MINSLNSFEKTPIESFDFETNEKIGNYESLNHASRVHGVLIGSIWNCLYRGSKSVKSRKLNKKIVFKLSNSSK